MVHVRTDFSFLDCPRLADLIQCTLKNVRMMISMIFKVLLLLLEFSFDSI